jgi:trimeric autotransporter adhesin
MKTIDALQNSGNRLSRRRGSIFIPLGLVALLAISPNLQAVVPAPDGGYPGGNTAEGSSALLSLSTGTYNTALGLFSLRSNTTGNFNTATGAGALLSNTADQNTATGAGALLSDTIGIRNTANGAFTLLSNTTGIENTANGCQALYNNTSGSENTANGAFALYYNTTGHDNAANGQAALVNNTTGNDNTADGVTALDNNTTGNNNIAVGSTAGFNLTTGDFNIDIGNNGVAGEAFTIRIGDVEAQTRAFIAGIFAVPVTGTGVVVDSDGQLGVAASSQRFKDEIKPMDKASEAILALKPVTFRYKHEIDPKRIPQFGLVAEEVEKVNPDLVACDAKGEPYTVRYDAVNAMLLNEFLKEHRKVHEQGATIADLRSAIARQRKDFETAMAQQHKQLQILTASLKEQAAQLQKVSAQVEVSKRAPQTVVDNR